MRRTLFLASTFLTLCAGFGALAVAQRGQQIGPPVTKHPHDLESSYIRLALPPSEQAFGRLQGDHLKEFDKQIVAFAVKDRDEGNLFWGRIAGTKNDDLVEGWVEAKFKEFGLQDVHRQYFDLPPQWFPTSWDFSATGSGKTLKFKTFRAATNSMPTPDAGLDLTPVWVGLGTESDFAGRDVKGKLVVAWSWPTPGVISNSAQWLGVTKRAADKGAAAVITNLAIPGNFQVQGGGNAATIPSFSLGTDDTNALRAQMEAGPVRVHVKLTTEMRSGLRDATVWGTLPGTSDEDIIVFAHHDSVFTGALDNASGMSVMVGLAEYFAKIPKEQRRRTIKFATTAGHHAGSYGTLWMHDNRATFLAKTALMINCEHVSATQTYYFGPVLRKSDNIDARRWWVNGSGKLAALVLNAYKTFGVTVYDEMEPNASGDMGHVARDVPSVQMIESPAWYHTDYDTPDVVPASGLEAVARAYAKIIDQANKLERRELLPGTPLKTTSNSQNH
jgi:hypothetical protein